MKKTVNKSDSAIVWQAPEYEYQPKDVSWFWVSLIISILLVAFALWQKNFLFAVFVMIAWFSIINLINKFPAIWNFKMDEKGIEISLPLDESQKKKFYPYKEIRGFDVHGDSEEHKELILKLVSRISPYLKINIYSKDEEKIKNLLEKFIAKEEYPPSFADHLMKFLRF